MALLRGIRLHQHLDDWLIRSQSQEETQVKAQTVVDLTHILRWIISGEVPTKTNSGVLLRGLRIPSRFSPCKNLSREMAQLQNLILRIKSKHVLTARCVMSLIGLLASTEKMVPEGCLQMRPFQFHLKEHWRYPQSLDCLLPWTETISAHLVWWQNPINMMKGSDFHPKDHSIQLFTDASNDGWGAHLDQSSTKGLGQNRKKGYT